MAPNLNSSDYYEILGCPRSTDEAGLKKAYRKLAVKWHPDKNPNDEQATKNFQKISEAYATLSDPQKRKLYDQYGVDGVNAADQMGENGAPGGFPGGGMPFHFGGGGPRSRGGGQQHMSSEQAEAFFSQFFGHDDPFGGLGGRRGGGGFHGGSPFGGSRVDPISMMFGGGMPGGGMPGGGMRGMPPQRRPSAPMYNAIPEGTTVSLKGLVSQPERNGDRGVIRQYNSPKDRYYVELEDSDETMLVKPSNLLQHVGVRLIGIESKPELNGKSGTIIAWNAQTERYSVYIMAISKGISLKPNNIVLDNGTVGQIRGLQSKPQLNGKWGTIKEWLRDAGRYSVQLSPTQIINIKLENIVV